MIYLTNDAMDQAVYLDLRNSGPRHGKEETGLRTFGKWCE